MNAFRRREERTALPTAPKPMIIIAQVAGSGTALPTSPSVTWKLAVPPVKLKVCCRA